MVKGAVSCMGRQRGNMFPNMMCVSGLTVHKGFSGGTCHTDASPHNSVCLMLSTVTVAPTGKGHLVPNNYPPLLCHSVAKLHQITHRERALNTQYIVCLMPHQACANEKLQCIAAL